VGWQSSPPQPNGGGDLFWGIFAILPTSCDSWPWPQSSTGSRSCQRARLVTAYLQSQSQASNLRQRRDKTQWILVLSTFHEHRSHVTANWGEIKKSGFQKVYTRSNDTTIINHQFWAPCQNGGGDRRRIVRFSVLQKLSDLDLGFCQGKVISACTVHIGLPANPAMWLIASSNMDIWPLEVHVISTFCKVWNHVIAFWEGNSEIGLRQAVGPMLS